MLSKLLRSCLVPILASGALADEWTLEQRVLPTGRPADCEQARAGAAVALHGDLLVVGAPRRRDGERHGAVEVRRFDGLSWVDEQVLLSPTEEPASAFGAAVAVFGDAIAVGAPDDAAGAGSVWVYRHDGRAWVLDRRLAPPLEDGEAAFGAAVALHEGVLAIGAPRAKVDGRIAGRVTVVESDGLFWNPAARLQAPDPAEGDGYGAALALQGPRLLVGIPGRGRLGRRSGEARLVRRETEGWVDAGALPTPFAAKEDRLGSSVALDGERALVGAPGANRGGPGRGCAVLYALGASGPAALRREFAPGSEHQETAFGGAVALRGERLVIAGSATLPPDGRAGLLHVHRAVDGEWREDSLLVAAPGQEDGFVPIELALSERAIAAGASLDRRSAGHSGSVSMFRARPDSQRAAAELARLVPDAWSRGRQLGHGVRLVGGRAFVGMPGDSEQELDGGAVHVFEHRDGSWRLMQRIAPEPARRRARFGESFHVHGRHLVVGAPGLVGELWIFEQVEEPEGTAEGELAPGAPRWVPVLHLREPRAEEDDEYGAAVLATDDTLFVAAPGRETADPERPRRTIEDAGVVHVYARPAQGWSALGQPPPPEADSGSEADDGPVPALLDEGPAPLLRSSLASAGSRFGHALCLEGTQLLVGCPGAAGGGAVELFLRDGEVWNPAQRLRPPRARYRLRFGHALDRAEGLLAVGAPGSIALGGEVHVYERGEAGFAPTEVLRPRPGVEARGFGRSVAVARDLVAVGAVDDSAAARSPGAVHLFERDLDRRWLQRGSLRDADSGARDRFGHALDLDGSRVLVGAPGADAGFGGARLFSLHSLPATGMLFSLARPVALPDGRVVTGGDVLHLERGRPATPFFDASDVLPADVRVDALCVHPDGALVLSFEGSVRIPGLQGGPTGEWVDGSDLVRFLAESWGSDTRGRLEFWLDGSDLGLDSPAEDVDAVSLGEDGEIHLSLRGAASVPGIELPEAALLTLLPERLGADTAGRLEVLLDLRTADLRLSAKPEDVDALHFRPGAPHVVLSTHGRHRAPGVPDGGPADLLVFRALQLGSSPSGRLHRSFSASEFGLGDCDVDGLHLFD